MTSLQNVYMTKDSKQISQFLNSKTTQRKDYRKRVQEHKGGKGAVPISRMKYFDEA